MKLIVSSNANDAFRFAVRKGFVPGTWCYVHEASQLYGLRNLDVYVTNSVIDHILQISDQVNDLLANLTSRGARFIDYDDNLIDWNLIHKMAATIPLSRSEDDVE